MEIFTKNSTIIKDEIEELLEALHHCNNAGEASHIFILIQVLAFHYKYMDDSLAENYIKKLNKNRMFVRTQYQLRNKKYKMYVKNLLANKEMHKSFSDRVLDADIIDGEYCDVEDCDISLSNMEMYEIESDFLRQYNRETLKQYNYMIDNDRFHYIPLCDYFRGTTIINLYKNSPHVTIFGDYGDIIEMITRQHEMGHITDELIYEMPRKDKYYYMIKSSLTEVISHMHEKDFIDFLIKENINPDYVSKFLNNFYRAMYDEFDVVNILCNLPDRLLIRNRYKHLSKFEFTEILLENPDLDIVSEEDIEPVSLDLSSSIEYGYGAALGIYFSSLKKNNKDKYEEQFSKFLKLRYDYFTNDFFEKIGTTSEEVINVVEDEINMSPAKIKIKKESNILS